MELHNARPVPNRDGYYVTKFGSIFSSKSGKLKRIRPYKTPDGYLFFNPFQDGKAGKVRIHRAVAEAFLPNPSGYTQINHKDGCKENNHVSNLEWCSPKQNMAHAKSNGLMARGEKIGTSKLPRSQVIEIREKYIPRKYTLRMLAAEYGVSHVAIRRVVVRESWNHC